MANNKIISTRIKNRFDTLDNWKAAGVELLPGEIALASVIVEQNDAKVPAVLMKVGDYKRDTDGNYIVDANGKKTVEQFSNLPWLSAQAADVYAWAKTKFSKDVEVEVSPKASTPETKTLGTWLKAFYDNDSEHADAIEGIQGTLDELLGENGAGGSIADAIAAAIDALDFADANAADDSAGSSAGKFVTVVTQTDGKIAVKKRYIAEIDLPNIHANKIIVSDAVGTEAAVMLPDKLTEIDDTLESHAEAIDDITTTSGIINTRISNALSNLSVTTDPASSGEAAADQNFVTEVRQANGQVSYTRKLLPVATTSKKGIVLLGADGGAATYDSIEGTGGLRGAVKANADAIENIRDAIAGGVHFIGVTTTNVALTANKTVNTVTIGTQSYTAGQGDIVIYQTQEFIWTGGTSGVWEPLGDVTRIGALESAIANLDYSNTTDSGANKFVTNVTQENGKIAVSFARPDATNISYNTDTVDAALDAHAGRLDAVEGKLEDVTSTVGASITAALDALDYTSPNTVGDTTDYQFIATVAQENGKISATKKTIPAASTSVKGVVQLYNGVDSTSTAMAATANAVKTVNDDLGEVDGRVTAVEGDYMRIGTDDKLYAGTSGTYAIIFDCGGAGAL